MYALDKRAVLPEPPPLPQRIRQQGFVYIWAQADQIKIGFSQNPLRRVAGLSAATGRQGELLACQAGTRLLEKRLHCLFASKRKHGEWFEPTQELLELAAQIRAEFGAPEAVCRRV